jgi:2',3'-cyclic-nucleotide 2'-phosphodiesterase (5'-nucleotidase family)
MPALQHFDFHVFVQLNDFYFLDARADYSKTGGLLLPRLATMVKRLKTELPGKVTVCVPGDFLAPSCLGKLSKGKHMVEIFGHIGVDLVTFGNHEFEQSPLTPATLAKNISNSGFKWLCGNFEPAANVLKAVFRSGNKVKPYEIVKLRDGLVAVLFGMTLADSYGAYGSASRPIDKAKTIIEEIRRAELGISKGEEEPVFIAMTHQDAADDRKFARRYPELLLVMGGHDHDEDYVLDESRPMIVKAASNARTLRFNVLLHRLHRELSPDLQMLWLKSRSLILNRAFNTMTYAAVDAAPPSVKALLVPRGEAVRPSEKGAEGFIDDTRLRSGIARFGKFDVGLYSFAIETFLPALVDHIPEDPATRKCIDRWEAFWDRRSGATRAPILILPVPFDARDGIVRRKSSNIGNLAADALRIDAAGNPAAAIGLLNSGSLRIDRKLPKGETITARTICDLLFFDNTVQTYELSGHELWQVLRKGFGLRSAGGAEGHGDFLQISGLKAVHTRTELIRVLVTGTGSEHDLPDDDTPYVVSTTDYVATISKHYKEFFAGKTGQQVGPYNRSFEAALRRLGTEDDRYGQINSIRWVPSKAAS